MIVKYDELFDKKVARASETLDKFMGAIIPQTATKEVSRLVLLTAQKVEAEAQKEKQEEEEK